MDKRDGNGSKVTECYKRKKTDYKTIIPNNEKDIVNNLEIQTEERRLGLFNTPGIYRIQVKQRQSAQS